MREKNQIFGRLSLGECLTDIFLRGIVEKYHYEEKDYAALGRVASDVRICIKDQENFCVSYDERVWPTGRDALVTLTLGAGIDLLQERYHSGGRLMESYMLENCSSELLRLGYEKVHQLIVEQTGMYVAQAFFFGGNDEYSLEQMAWQLKERGIKNISCTADYCLRPTKSVVYCVRLGFEEPVAKSICSDCANRLACRQCFP